MGGTLLVPSEYGTIWDAMTAAATGDTVLVGPGTYTNCDGGPCHATVADLKAGVTLLSEAGPEVTTIHLNSGASGLGILVGFGASNAIVEGFTLRSAETGKKGIVVVSGSNVRISRCNFVDIVRGGQGSVIGGAIFVNGGSNRIENCTFLRCGAAEGSGIGSLNGSTVIESCRFEDCVGNAVVLGPLPSQPVAVRNCVFLRNTAFSGGGGLVLDDTRNAIVEDNVFIGNSAPVGGGAIAAGSNGGVINLRRNLFLENRAGASGGAVVWFSFGFIEGNTFVRNLVDEIERYGAAILSSASTSQPVYLRNNIFFGNVGDVAVEALNSSPIGSCNLFFSNPDGDSDGYDFAPTDLFVDPRFCDPESDNFTLESVSPCLPENSNGCGLIGVYGEGCGATSIESSSWGKIKSLYSNQGER